MTSVAASAMTQSDPSAQRAPTDTVSAAHIIGNVTLDDPSAGYGALRLQPTGLSWAAREGTYSVEVARVDLEALWWLRGARGYQLRCRRRDGTEARFEALRTADRDAIDRYARKVLGLSSGVQNAEQASRGWNFGQVRVHAEDDTVQLETGGERALAVPLSDVAQALRTGRNEVSLEFHLDDTAGRADENLVEMRFQLPSEEDAEALQKAVAARADTTSFAGESIAFFEELPLIVPRGRYDFELFPHYLSLHGKSFDYKILYKTVRRMFLLPKPDELHIAFVISLDPPIRQGNTTYPHLVLQLKRDEEEVEVELNMSEEELRRRFGDKLEQRMRGELWQVVTKVLRAFVDKPLHAPKGFVTSQGVHALRTALGASDGYLYPLENCFFFVNKPPTYVRYDDVDFVEFKRLELDRRFDMNVVLLNGVTLSFTNLEKNEFQRLHEFLDSKKVRMVGAPRGMLRNAAVGGAGGERGPMRAAAQRAEMAIAEEEAAVGDLDGDEDEDESDEEEDEDFAAAAADADAAAEESSSEEEEVGEERPSKKRRSDVEEDGESDDSDLEAELVDEDEEE
ncbi:hypothetical protein CDCA_CDCA17G4448 [Cyanidium caldarium]|uniref:FACT complex subunit SSRP1 n=1 Tax=Cyanidium caldarium TaxID=2771 RepID=A0AAV9J1E8_CYACA|nr:hypothetical protein CDCA_CDCA17G4448 [Cyanidium caldarium]